MTSMKIIHMSDLHIADKGKPIWDTDTLAHFDAAVERIRTEVNIDAIFITGDIADNGSKWAYDSSGLNVPPVAETNVPGIAETNVPAVAE